MSSLPRPNRNAARTNPGVRPPASSSDTNAPQNRDPTSSPCQQEFFRPRRKEVGVMTKANAIGDSVRSDEEIWLRGLDLNKRPSGYEPDELPGCSTPRIYYLERDHEIKPKMRLTNSKMAPAVGFEPTTN